MLLQANRVPLLLALVALATTLASLSRADDVGPVSEPSSPTTTVDPGENSRNIEPAGRARHAVWPYAPPRRPTIPVVAGAGWLRNPIDAFVLHRLEADGLAPNAAADRSTLLRRVTFDLTGLPPTVDEVVSFLADDSYDAYEKVVDRLLASSAYGERWAQHWLDVVRYAETDGFKEDALRPTAYRYRDYVIDALNEDLPYDRFLRQQIAGDELEPENPAAQIATGLLRLYPDESNAANMVQRRQEILDDITENTGLAFLGLTMGCAQCHDHKFDDISQVDYFRLQAFFSPMMPRDDIPVASREECRLAAARRAEWEAATVDTRRRIDELLAKVRSAAREDVTEKFDEDTQRALRTPIESRSVVQSQLAYQAARYVDGKVRDAANQLSKEDKERLKALEAELAAFDSLKPAPLPTAIGVVDAGVEPPKVFRLAAGNFRRPLEEVAPGFPALLGASDTVSRPTEASVPSAADMRSSGRRSSLAKWLTTPDHPLTARVIVNRLWLHHFGEGIVRTPNDFGAMGDAPTHPELLDWLATELTERGWKLKSIHRLIITSATYRQSSLVDARHPLHARAINLDPANKFLWHTRRTRLEGEAIRDAALQVSGQLNRRMHGPSARPELPQGISSYAWQPDQKVEDRQRRSIYVLAKRNLRYPLMDAFDLPDMHNSCARRSTTTTAPQALLLLNGEFAHQQAEYWALRLAERHKFDEAGLICQAFVEGFGRQPTIDEIASAQAFLREQAASLAAVGKTGDAKSDSNVAMSGDSPSELSAARLAALSDFCQMLLNSNEFLFVD